MAYVSGFVTPVKLANKEAYLRSAQTAAPLFKELGALSVVETWGDNLPDGKQTDFKMAVKAEADETVAFSWIVWPDRAASDAAEQAMRTDPRFEGLDMPFDGKRMIFGGFEVILDTAA